MAVVVGNNAGITTGALPHENSWEVWMNKNLRLMDALLQGLVLDKDLTAPPGSPTMGDLYIVGPSPTGAWAGQANSLAFWAVGSDITSTWLFVSPKEGWSFYVGDEDKRYLYNGTSWTDAVSTGALTSSSLITAAKGGTNGITVGNVTSNSGSVIRMQGTSVGHNFQFDNNVNFAGLSISPSTVVGGTTYTTPTWTFTAAGAMTVTGPIKAGGYTVSTLPAGVVGQRAYVTDALTPVFGSAVVGGGAVVVPVFRNATVWIVG